MNQPRIKGNQPHVKGESPKEKFMTPWCFYVVVMENAQNLSRRLHRHCCFANSCTNIECICDHETETWPHRRYSDDQLSRIANVMSKYPRYWVMVLCSFLQFCFHILKNIPQLHPLTLIWTLCTWYVRNKCRRQRKVDIIWKQVFLNNDC